MHRLIPFFRWTLFLALVGFVSTIVLALQSGIGLPLPYGELSISRFSVGLATSLILTTVVNLAIWLFLIWSLLFVPFLVHAVRGAARSAGGMQLRTRPVRWIQLYALAFLPIATFATAWNSLPSTNAYAVTVLSIHSVFEGVTLVVSVLGVVGLLFLLNHAIPIRFAPLRLALLSGMLYTSLFLSYGLGLGLASNAMVFGIFIYLARDSHAFADLIERLTLHDLPPDAVSKVEQLLAREADSSLVREDLVLRQKDQEYALERELASITEKKINLTRRVNAKQLEVLSNTIDNLSEVFGILADAHKEKVADQLHKSLEDFRADVNKLEPAQIQAQLGQVLEDINRNAEGVALAAVRTQVLQLTKDLEVQTRLLLSDGASGTDQAAEN